MTPTRIQRARRGVLVALTATALAGSALALTGPPALHATAATASAPGVAVSQAIDSSSHNIYVAAQGPNHELFFYWDISGTWYGPVAVGGAGSTYSAPSMTVDSSHHVVIAAEGPGNNLFFYWNVNGTWYGPLQVGSTGNDLSTPSLISDVTGNLDLVVQSPGQALSFYWNTAAAWYGPYGLGGAGSALSRPSAGSSTISGHHFVNIVVQGPDNSLLLYQNKDGAWNTPAHSNAQTTFAAPSMEPDGAYADVRGAGDDLDQWQVTTSGTNAQLFGFYPVGPGNTTGSSPSGSDENDVAALGPSNALYYYWYTDGGWRGPLGVGGPGSSFSIPSMTDGDAGPSIAVQGPGNSLYFYWDINGTWYGPLGIGAAGSTFSSAS